MKRFTIAVFVFFLFVGNLYAVVSSMTVTNLIAPSINTPVALLKVVCIADSAAATFVSTQLVTGVRYWEYGYSIADVWAVNDATTYPAAGAVTITDETTRQLVGTTAGDTLTLSTAASGVGYLTIDRGSGQRAVTSKLTVAVSTITTNSGKFTLYILLRR